MQETLGVAGRESASLGCINHIVWNRSNLSRKFLNGTYGGKRTDIHLLLPQNAGVPKYSKPTFTIGRNDGSAERITLTTPTCTP